MPLSSYGREEDVQRAFCDILRDLCDRTAFLEKPPAGRAGNLVRYFKKLSRRPETHCSHFIDSVRLDHAARLLERGRF